MEFSMFMYHIPSSRPEVLVGNMVKYSTPPFQQFLCAALRNTTTVPKMVHNWPNPRQEVFCSMPSWLFLPA